MKKIVSLFAFAALMVSASCQKIETGSPVSDNENVVEQFTTPASAGALTKMGYNYSSDESGWGITKQWSEGDSLIGFVVVGNAPEEYKYFTYKCSGIDGNLAIWTRVPEASSEGWPKSDASAKFHMAFAPGVSASSFAGGGKAAVSSCNGAIASGTGNYDSATGKLDIKFANQCAMICLVDPVFDGVTSSKTLRSIEVSGAYTSASLELVDGTLTLVPDKASAGKAEIDPTDGTNWKTDAAGKLTATVFIPVFPGTKLSDLSVRFVANATTSYYYNVSAEETLAADAYRIKGRSFKLMEAEYRIGTGAPVAIDSFRAAVDSANAAKDSTVITLQRNVSLTDSVELTNATAPVILDLNGKTLTAANTSVAHSAIQMNTEGSVLTVCDRSSGAKGIINQLYGGTAYTIIVNSGTLNVTSGTVSNSSSAGYGRVAIKIGKLEGVTPPTVNISGGYVYGGRAIVISSELDGDASKLNITGGKIEGKYTASASDIYAAIYVGEHSHVKIPAGTIISTKAPCIYVRAEMSDVEVVLGASDRKSAPYLYTSGNTKCINGGNAAEYKVAAYKKFRIYKCYWNKNLLESPDQNCATVTTLSAAVKDSYGYKYGYLVEAAAGGKDSGAQPVKNGDTSDWY